MTDKPLIEEIIDISFQNPIIKDPVSGWYCVELPNSGEILGTRNPIKIAGTIEAQPFEGTLMPLGNGNHMLPIKASLRKQISKDFGDEVKIHIVKRTKKA